MAIPGRLWHRGRALAALCGRGQRVLQPDARRPHPQRASVGLDALWPEVFAPYVSCADAAAKLLGVPYEFYSLTLFAVLAATATWVLRRSA